MKCLSIRRIYDYLENQLPEPQKAECEAHLKKCSRCRRLAADRRRFLSAADTLPELSLPDAFPLQVMARIRARDSLVGKWLWLGIGAALPLSFLLIGTILIRFGPLESWTGIISSLVNLIQQAAFTLIKGIKVIMIFLHTIGGFLGLILEKVWELASLVPPETPYLATAVLILMTAAFLFGLFHKSRLGANK